MKIRRLFVLPAVLFVSFVTMSLVSSQRRVYAQDEEPLHPAVVADEFIPAPVASSMAEVHPDRITLEASKNLPSEGTALVVKDEARGTTLFCVSTNSGMTCVTE